MNIFVLDENPVRAAQLQCDKHVVKMILESGQMLSTAHRVLDGVKTKGPSKSGKRMVDKWHMSDSYKEDLLYKAVHVNHPCTVWTMESLANYAWHYDHFCALAIEYEYRYKKKHATFEKLEEILSMPPRNIPQNVGQTPFKLAMQHEPQCMHEKDPVRSYQEYYYTKRDRFDMKWTERPVPDWFVSQMINENNDESLAC
tara:strand:- start:6497 stop:7093 length:597 start_codon:yes stop_codon:yes gene_type:complete